jgi:integrase
VWQLRVSVGQDADGKYRQRSRTFHGNATDARRALHKFAAELAADPPATASRMTFGDLLSRWLADRATRGREPETLRNYRQHAGRLTAALGTIPLAKLSADDLDGFYQALHAAGRSPATIGRYHSTVRAALNWAVQRQWIAHNPAPATSRPTPRRPDLRVPTPDEVRTILAAADGQLAVFLHLAVDTWCRRGELIGLRRSSVNLEAGEALISQAVSGRTVKGTKTHGLRVVSLSPETLNVLTDHFDRQDKLAAAAGVGWLPGGFVFSDDVDGEHPWHPDQATGGFRRAAARAGVTGVRLHDLRHFGPTQALAAGASIVAVSHRLGHAKVSMTLDTYSHHIPANDQPLSAQMGRILAGLSITPKELQP